MKTERLDACESLRGVAVILVFAFHFLGTLVGYGPRSDAHAATALFFGGSTGVDLFFVLSGFLLSLPYFGGSPLKLRQYFTNRALRILPMYYLMVLVGMVWNSDWHGALSAALFWNLGLNTLQPFGLVWWSLAAEVQFYLALPAAIWMARSRWGRYVLAVSLAVLCWCYWHIASPVATPFWVAQRNDLLGRWPQFATGIGAAWAYHRFSATWQAWSDIRRRWVGTGVALGAILALNAVTVHGLRQFGALKFAFWYAEYLIASVLWAVFLLAMVGLAPAGRRLIINPVLHRVGEWSYSIYLIHATLLVFTFMRLGIQPSTAQSADYATNILLFIGIAGATLLLSATTYYLVERPFLRLKHSSYLKIGKVTEDAM